MEGDTSLIKKLEVNTKFNSYEELKQSLTQFEKDNYIQLWKPDTLTSRRCFVIFATMDTAQC
jgi:hypothetical protein